MTPSSSFSGQGEAGVGDPYLFLALAAVLVGGTSLVGARGDYWRTVLGALIMTLVTTILVGHGAGEALQEIPVGRSACGTGSDLPRISLVPGSPGRG